ncbi:class I SAM-dependent methyltransferase [Mucilaginibacter ginkgonis]|uniref:Class I SAM-dependent methyltransferase n=1 Tax=Mucilaginibacter ginkgonis TaxID=2682091 RepID=A0A6I4HUE0_9SPHI|nr:class I SAM-dependent methyltransferase [Mucilaginibacter ginkgonis]QQL50195.1 class I SAM-dependent methyltransferase [Mucilaginibacter ginkgonis]
MEEVWTGERLETFISNETTIEHLHRYGLALMICVNKDVLDIASGEGYGSNLLSGVAQSVTGVDISGEAVTAAAKKYLKSNLKFKQGSAALIPLADASIDVVVSFETIEHHDQHQEMIAEIKRVLKPSGVLLMSSPDKKYYSDMPGYNNPYHVKELYFEQFKALINANFSFSSFLSQKIVTGSLIIPEHPASGFDQLDGDYNTILREPGFNAVYNLCLASDKELANVFPVSLFDGSAINRILVSTAVKNAADHATKQTEQRFKTSGSYKIGRMLSAPLRLFRSELKSE